jgi:hypothetical protein
MYNQTSLAPTHIILLTHYYSKFILVCVELRSNLKIIETLRHNGDFNNINKNHRQPQTRNPTPVRTLKV